jgi:hypothetical protein
MALPSISRISLLVSQPMGDTVRVPVDGQLAIDKVAKTQYN